MYLDLVAVKATQLAYDLRSNKLWPGDLTDGMRQIRENLEKATNSGSGDTHG